MRLTEATLTTDELGKILANGIKGPIQELMQDTLERELTPKLKQMIAEHVKKTMENFASYKLKVHEDLLSQRVIVNIQFAESQRDPRPVAKS